MVEFERCLKRATIPATWLRACCPAEAARARNSGWGSGCVAGGAGSSSGVGQTRGERGRAGPAGAAHTCYTVTHRGLGHNSIVVVRLTLFLASWARKLGRLLLRLVASDLDRGRKESSKPCFRPGGGVSGVRLSSPAVAESEAGVGTEIERAVAGAAVGACKIAFMLVSSITALLTCGLEGRKGAIAPYFRLGLSCRAGPTPGT